MKQHVKKVAATCYYHLRLLAQLCQIRRRVGSEVTTQLVLALIISRLDYCKAALAGLPQTTIAPLQRVQNAAARWVQGSTSLHVFSNCIGCLSAGASSSNCAALRIQFSTETVRRIYQTWYRQCQQTSSSLTIIVIDRLGITTTSHQVRRARLFLCWSVCMEQTT